MTTYNENGNPIPVFLDRNQVFEVADRVMEDPTVSFSHEELAVMKNHAKLQEHTGPSRAGEMHRQRF